MGSKPMYSEAWFATFAARVPESVTAAEVAAVTRLAPPEAFPKLLDVGCGTGRVARPLAAEGYQVTGIDTSVEALLAARHSAPRVTFVALDQRHVGELRWSFDVVVVLWNSIGFGSRSDDRATLRGLHGILRPGGRVLLDLYHPDWLQANEQTGVRDARGAIIDRWVEEQRSCHEIRYADGSVDRMSFNVYRPVEIERVLVESGFRPDGLFVRWEPDSTPGPEHARYQVVSTRMAVEDQGESAGDAD